MLEGVAVFLGKLRAEINDFRCCIRDLDRIRLDVRHREAALLDLILQSAHEQSTAQRNDVVGVLAIPERVLKGCRR